MLSIVFGASSSIKDTRSKICILFVESKSFNLGKKVGVCCRRSCMIFWRSKHRAGGFVELDNQEKSAGQSDDQMKLPPAKPIT